MADPLFISFLFLHSHVIYESFTMFTDITCTTDGIPTIHLFPIYPSGSKTILDEWVV